jgi:excinuclease ABC subunit A
VIIIEHNLDIIRNADYILDMGPEGGEGGGRVIAHGTPEQVATVTASHTGSFLAKYYDIDPSKNGHHGGVSFAGAQPLGITAAADKQREPKAKFVAPERKTGVPKARAAAAADTAVETPKAAKKTAKKAAKTVTKAATKKSPGRPRKA